MEARITAIATAAPKPVSISLLARLVSDDVGGDFIAKIFEGSKIDEKSLAVNPIVEDIRHWPVGVRMERALQEAHIIGREAVSKALKISALPPEDVGLFAVCSTTAVGAPGLTSLAPELGISCSAHRLAIGPMGCAGAGAALDACAAWVSAHGRPAVLLCVDVFSAHVQPGPYSREAGVLFAITADAAAALTIFPSSTARQGMDIVDSESLTSTKHADYMTLNVHDSGVTGRLDAAVPSLVGASVKTPVSALLQRHDLSYDDISWWAVHPGGRKIVEQASAALRLPQASVEAALDVHRVHGNAGAPTVYLVLEKLMRECALRPGEHAVLVTFGPGVTVCAVLLRGAGQEEGKEYIHGNS